MSQGDNYTAVILEEIRSQNKAVLEVVGQMQDQMNTLATKDALQAVADDVTTIKVALKATNQDLANHEVRITTLEQAA